MDGVSATIYTKLRRYWRRRNYRRNYRRIDTSARRRGPTIELGGAKRRRFWRVKIKKKLKIFKTANPKKFLVWLRDAYVKMMLGFANSRVIGPGYGDYPGFGGRPLKEYDEKMIVQIYKSLVAAQGQIVPAGDARLASVSRLSAIAE